MIDLNGGTSVDPVTTFLPSLAKFSTLYMATNSKWTTEEDSILVEAISAGTPQIVFITEVFLSV